MRIRKGGPIGTHGNPARELLILCSQNTGGHLRMFANDYRLLRMQYPGPAPPRAAKYRGERGETRTYCLMSVWAYLATWMG